MDSIASPHSRKLKRGKARLAGLGVAAAITAGTCAAILAASANADSSGSVCAVQSCDGPSLEEPNVPPGQEDQSTPLTGSGFSADEAREDAITACETSFGGQATITSEYSESDEDGEIFYADADCAY